MSSAILSVSQRRLIPPLDIANDRANAIIDNRFPGHITLQLKCVKNNKLCEHELHADNATSALILTYTRLGSRQVKYDMFHATQYDDGNRYLTCKPGCVYLGDPTLYKHCTIMALDQLCTVMVCCVAFTPEEAVRWDVSEKYHIVQRCINQYFKGNKVTFHLTSLQKVLQTTFLTQIRLCILLRT